MSGSVYTTVIVKTYPEDKIPDSWAREMEKWMGKEVTLKIVDNTRYSIMEDPKWCWEPDNFIFPDGYQINPNFLFKEKKMRNDAIR